MNSAATAYYPLTQQQLRMMGNSEQGLLGNYLLPGHKEILKYIDPDLLEKAYQHLLKTDRFFRIKFDFSEDEPRMEELPAVKDSIRLVDFSHLPPEEAEKEADEFRASETRPLPLDECPLYRVYLLKLSEEWHVIFYIFQHFMADHYSNNVFLNRLSSVYRDLINGKTPATQDPKADYLTYSCWQNERLSDTLHGAKAHFWSQKLKAPMARAEVATDFPEREGARDLSRNSFYLKLSDADSRAVAQYCRQGGIMPIAFFMGLYLLLLKRWSGADDQSFLSLFKGRHEYPELKDALGLFMNLALIRYQFGEEMTARHFFKSVQKEIMKVYRNQDFPHRLVGRDLFSLSHYSFNFFNDHGFDRLSKGNEGRETWITNYAHGEIHLLTFIVLIDHNIRLQLHYPPYRFREERIEHMVEGMEAVLRQVCLDDSIALSALLSAQSPVRNHL